MQKVKRWIHSGSVPIYKVHDALKGYAIRIGVSQFDLPSLTPLSVAGRGRLQLGVARWATSVALLQDVYNSPNIQW